METTRISVIMPVRDVAEVIDDALGSLLRQTEGRLEILVGDDGSTDGTRDRLATWARRDARIRPLPGPPMGMVPCLNRLLPEARAPWIARMDGDDLLHPERFAAQLALAAETGAGAVGCRIRLFPSQEVSPSMKRWLRWQNGLCSHEEILRERYVETTISHATLLVERERLERLRGWRVFDGPEDLDLLLRLAENGTRFAKVPRLHYFWRWHPAMSTRRDERYRRAAFRTCKIDRLLDGPLVGVRSLHLWGVGRSLESWRDALAARGLAVHPRTVDVKALRRREPRAVAALAAPPPPPLLLVFGMPRVRAELRSGLVRGGAREGRDFLFVA